LERDGPKHVSAKSPQIISSNSAKALRTVGRMHNPRLPPSKGTHRTRLGRVSIPGQIYHVIAATKNRRPHFAVFERGRFVVQALMRVQTQSIATTIAYVVMPDHLHWLMQIHRQMDLSTCVGNIKSYSARKSNATTGSRGSVWQRGFSTLQSDASATS